MDGVKASSKWSKPLLWPKVLDKAEVCIILLLWLQLVVRIDLSNNPLAPLVLISETALVFFTVIRRPTDKVSMRPRDWLLALTATCAPLLIVPSDNLFPALAPLGVVLILSGNVIQAYAKLILRRSFGLAPANRGIKLDGPYRVVRHPMYAGYLLVHIGVIVLMISPINLVIYAVGWSAQILRMLAEERLLSEDPTYRDYMQRVRWRLIPSVF